MFFLFKQDPIKKLEKQYLRLMEEAKTIQRKIEALIAAKHQQ